MIFSACEVENTSCQFDEGESTIAEAVSPVSNSEITQMFDFLNSGKWCRVEIMNGSAPEFVGVILPFLENVILVDNDKKVYEVPHQFGLVEMNYPSQGITSVVFLVNNNKDITSGFETDGNLKIMRRLGKIFKMRLWRESIGE
jgi:hypothetical protein